MVRAARRDRLPLHRALALILVLAVVLPGSAASQTTSSGSDFRISAGTSIRLDGQGPSTFGDMLGLDYRAGILRAAWADNSSSADLDLATAGIAVSSGGAAAVGPTVIVRAAEDQTGPSLGIDPSVAGRVLAVARHGTLSSGSPGLLRARSTDAGNTWVATTDPVGVPDSEVSPDLACDGFGNCFLAFLSASDPFNPQLRLALSTNGGQSFSPVALPDMPGFGGDASVAAGAGSVWLAFTGFDTAPRLRTLAAPVTGLGAVGTFSRQDVPRTTIGNKPDIAVGPGGKALVVTQHLSNGTISFVESSVDPDGLGPAGFQAPVRVATGGDYPFQAMPQAAWDRTRDRAYIVYRGNQLVAGEHGAGTVFLRSSSDSGLSWSAAVRVNADVVSEDRLVPNVAVDSATGNVGVAWYDFRAGHGQAQLFGRVLPAAEPPPPGVPAAPANLSATAVSRSQINLSWEDRSGNETGFELTRSSSGTSPQTIRLGANTTSFIDTALAEDTTYTYVVRAFNGAGLSEPSDEASATTLDSPPSAPTNLVATAVGSDQVDLDWGPADDPDGYEIQRSLDGVAWTSLGQPAGTATEATILGLAPETTYFFRVRAFNSGGNGPFSNVASARTGAAVPSAPASLQATAVSRSRIDLSWSDSSTNETRFEIQRTNAGRPFELVATASANSVSFVDTGLRARTTYTYRIRACNQLGCSAFSNQASATTPRR
jgi:fibronectin type 3 domain-containing protein